MKDSERIANERYSKAVNRWRVGAVIAIVLSFVVALILLALIGFGVGVAVVPSSGVSGGVALVSIAVVEWKKRHFPLD